jgi:hypothetical protein
MCPQRDQRGLADVVAGLDEDRFQRVEVLADFTGIDDVPPVCAEPAEHIVVEGDFRCPVDRDVVVVVHDD